MLFGGKSQLKEAGPSAFAESIKRRVLEIISLALFALIRPAHLIIE